MLLKLYTVIETQEIRDAKWDGKIVWICDFRYNDYSNKPIRSIKPSKVLVRNNSKTTRTIYYSESHFIGLNKNNEPLKSKIITLFDNTGHRSYTGVALNCFETEEECVKHYKKQVRVAIKGLRGLRTKITETIDLKIDELQGEF